LWGRLAARRRPGFAVRAHYHLVYQYFSNSLLSLRLNAALLHTCVARKLGYVIAPETDEVAFFRRPEIQKEIPQTNRKLLSILCSRS
jgi:hypothetical protein